MIRRNTGDTSAAGGGAGRNYRNGAAALLSLFVLAGCSSGAPYLVPAPGAATPPGRDHAVMAEADQIRVVANGDAWHGYPANLGTIVTPVKLDIRNNSNTPIRISYRDFQLSGGGFSSAALPPYRITGSVAEPTYTVAPVVPAFSYNDFFLAPGYSPYYDWNFDQWDGPFEDDLGYYGTYYTMWNVSLPTQDMRAQGIPEGVLSPGGELSGFLYFQKVTKSSGPATLTFDLTNANNSQSMGKVNLAFEVK